MMAESEECLLHYTVLRYYQMKGMNFGVEVKVKSVICFRLKFTTFIEILKKRVHLKICEGGFYYLKDKHEAK